MFVAWAQPPHGSHNANGAQCGNGTKDRVADVRRRTRQGGKENVPPQLSLVGGWVTPLKNMKVNWDDYSQY